MASPNMPTDRKLGPAHRTGAARATGAQLLTSYTIVWDTTHETMKEIKLLPSQANPEQPLVEPHSVSPASASALDADELTALVGELPIGDSADIASLAALP